MDEIVKPKMRLLGCGSRDLWVPKLVANVVQALIEHYTIECIIEGGANGVDLAFRAASQSILNRQPMEFKVPRAAWLEQGKTAGHNRNSLMLDVGQPTHVVAITNKPLDESPGTKNMITQAFGARLPIAYLHPMNDTTLEDCINWWVAMNCPFYLPPKADEEPVNVSIHIGEANEETTQ